MEQWREELYHHGIAGMHWGIRRYQRSDGTLTSLGKRRYMQDLRDKKTADAYSKITEKRKQASKKGEQYKLTNKEKSVSRQHTVNAVEKLLLNPNSRAKVHNNISLGRNKVASYLKGVLGTGITDGLKTSTVGLGSAAIATLMGVFPGTGLAVGLGVAGSRIVGGRILDAATSGSTKRYKPIDKYQDIMKKRKNEQVYTR